MRGGTKEPTVGGQEECVMCGRRFRVETLEPGTFDHTTGQWDIVALGDLGCDGDHHIYYPRCWEYRSAASTRSRRQVEGAVRRAASSGQPWPDEGKWLEALDEAIAKVTWREYCQLKRQHPADFTARLQLAFESIEKLQRGEQPCYDRWDALLYVSWYQARQIHLVSAVLRQYPPPRSTKRLQIVDFGCGAWAAPIALAMVAAGGHPALHDREVSIYRIESKDPMDRIGKLLWCALFRAAEKRGLMNTGSANRMIPGDAYLDRLAHASAEVWLLAIHALYDESQRDVKSFLDRYRERLASGLRYELLTTHKSKRRLLESVVDGDSREQTVGLKPIWTGTLIETTKCRRRIREALSSGKPMSDKYVRYLKNAVAWNPRSPGTPIEQDAVWVRGAVQ